MYDIIIVGAGPAGLTAAIYARRAGKSVLLLEKETFGGQITFSPKVENYPGFAALSGSELADKMTEQALALGAEAEPALVQGIREGDGCKEVQTDLGTYEGRAVILATGARHRRLGLEREESLIGHGISFCAVCDGAFFAGRDVAVIGGGNSALQEALLLAETSRRVYIVQNLPYLTGEGKLCEAVEARENITVICSALADAYLGEPELSGLVIAREGGQKETLAVDGVFLAVGLAPENGAFADVVPLDERGYVAAGEDCTTPAPGIFVAGDCRTKAIRQVTTATADGAVAGLAAVRYLDQGRQ